ncbi:PmoA family protein [Planctomicrobium sp. SH664]|uniref:DUF6807 domain-containing protein n=1 Tax=Planctomicrobium sp. SH664 TaxID=3448125 RepID=UPI003F5AE124
MRFSGCWIVLCSTFASLCLGAEVELKQGQHSVKATIDGEVFTVYRYSPDRQKPFFQPLVAPGALELLDKAEPSSDEWDPGRKVFVAAEESQLKVGKEPGETVKYGDVLEVGKIEGDWLWIADKKGWIRRSDVAPLAAVVTRMINDNPSKVKDRKKPEYYDHVHHKGVWFTLDEVGGVNYWAEIGKVATQKVEIIKAKGNPAVFKVTNHWLKDKSEEPALIETTTVSLYGDRLLAYDVTLSAGGEDIILNDTKEGMFAVRLPNSMRENDGGGPVISSEGVEGASKSWGKPARWIDYNGPVDGQSLGVTVMDDPKNPWASRYHVRDYGLFAINPFGEGSYSEKGKDAREKKPYTLKKGEPIRFRFGLWVHGDNTDKAQIEKVYEEFTAGRE